MCTEEIPRQERAQESYVKQSVLLDSKVFAAWTKFDESRKKLYHLCEQALNAHPDLDYFIKNVHLNSKLRQSSALESLKQKLVSIQNAEINAFTEYMSDMPRMLKKLYLTLKGYDKVPPALTAEYLEVMRKAKSAKGITWSDKVNDTDAHFKFITTLDTHKPSTTLDLTESKTDVNATVDIVTDSEDLTDIENKEPVRLSAKKRKGTPIKLANNETIIINDSFESLDTTRNMNSAKKIKREYNIASDIENYEPIDPKDLNSTFVLNDTTDIKKSIKTEVKVEPQPVKRGLFDRTNTLQQKPLTFGDKG